VACVAATRAGCANPRGSFAVKAGAHGAVPRHPASRTPAEASRRSCQRQHVPFASHRSSPYPLRVRPCSMAIGLPELDGHHRITRNVRRGGDTTGTVTIERRQRKSARRPVPTKYPGIGTWRRCWWPVRAEAACWSSAQTRANRSSPRRRWSGWPRRNWCRRCPVGAWLCRRLAVLVCSSRYPRLMTRTGPLPSVPPAATVTLPVSVRAAAVGVGGTQERMPGRSW